jgi:hypothetical protein
LYKDLILFSVSQIKFTVTAVVLLALVTSARSVASRKSFFKNSGDETSKDDSEVDLGNIDNRSMVLVLQFLYSGDIACEVNEIAAFMRIMDFLGIKTMTMKSVYREVAGQFLTSLPFFKIQSVKTQAGPLFWGAEIPNEVVDEFN